MVQYIIRFINGIRVNIILFTLVFFVSCNSRDRATSIKERSRYNTEKVANMNDRSSTRGRNNPNNRTVNTNKSTINTKIESGTSNNILMTGSDIFSKYNTAVFMIYTSDGKSGLQGSGFFISEDGIGVSNYHVFEGTLKGKEEIRTINGYIYKIKNIIKYNKEKDYIVFKVDNNSTKFNYIHPSTLQPKIGERVYAIGSPRGLENTFSSGEISQLRKSGDEIQISVPITHGSSGGALINEKGKVIGITTSGYGEANLNFAVSINCIFPISDTNIDIANTYSYN